MDKILYEIHYHSVNDRFSHCTVTPIKVIREGILPGCSASSITAIASDGHKFQGSADNFFESEALAWEEVKADLQGSLQACKASMEELAAELDAINKFLKEIT